ncbi:unnamed protein product [Echinostoma caproni]|uniref:phosphatidylserine decarboxylase n=1 Tax=Echinostoma caproni TaxID=27848 RepID=A0A183ACN6_9TREM|nr:unnamed protein product [Echinostoma caproni]
MEEGERKYGVSPADGRVLSCGRIEAGHLEQVKGLFYTLRGLLGPNTWTELEKISNGGTSLNSNLTSGLHPVRSAVDLTVQHRICVTGRGLDYLPVYPSTNVQVNKTSTPVLGRTRQTARSSCAASRSLRLEDYLYAQSLLLGPSGSQFPCDGSSSCLESNSPVWEDDQITDLYHLLVYLAPGDYHRFHSPTDWSIQMRRHFPGKLYSVAPPFVRQLDRLYCTNERVIYVGRWRYGFFAYVAVGATNVGSISVYKDPDLVTNMPIRPKQLARIWPMIQRGPDAETTRTDRGSEADFRDLHFTEQIAQTKGELFGQFNFGSTTPPQGVLTIFISGNNFLFIRN